MRTDCTYYCADVLSDFEEGRRICSKIGGGLRGNVTAEEIDDSVPGFDYRTMADKQRYGIRHTFAECQEREARVSDEFNLRKMLVEFQIPRDEPEPALFYHSDHLGSTAYVTYEGDVVQTLNYLPYGEDWVEVNTLDHFFDTTNIGIYRFNGKEKDWESGFHYYGARYYWSEVLTGWLSVDPMTDKYPNTSPYVYCSWNPILFVDPDGKEKLIYYNTNTPKQSSFKGVGANIRFQNAMSTWKSNCSLKSSANRYKDSDGVIHLFAHGSSQKVDLAEKGTKDALGLDVFLTNTSKTYKENVIKGETSLLIMHACSTGKGENSIAQKLSKNTNGDLLIFAPSDDDLLGRNEKVDNSGVWNVFYKGELLGTYNGNTDFSKEIAEKGAQNIINFWKKKHEDNHVNE